MQYLTVSIFLYVLSGSLYVAVRSKGALLICIGATLKGNSTFLTSRCQKTLVQSFSTD